MSLLTITKAVNASIARSVQVSELKHVAKLDDLRLQLASQADLRIKSHAEKHVNAVIAHANWHEGLNPAGKQQYIASMQLLHAAINPTPTES